MSLLTRKMIVAQCSALIFLAAAVQATSAERVLAHLPSETLLVARVARLDRLDEAAQPLAKNFGLAFPALGSMAGEIEGIDPAGEAVVGVTEFESGVYLPFVLLPVSDYRALVRSGDGDPAIEVTPVTLAGEELLASQRGKWALVTNVVEPFESLGKLDAKTAEQLSSKFGDELLSVVVTDSGLTLLKNIASSSGQSPRQLSNLRRLLASRPVNWRSLDEWRQRLVVQQEMVERLRAQCSSVVLAIHNGDDLQLDVRAVFIPREDFQVTSAAWSGHPLTLPDERLVATAHCAWGSPWVDWIVRLQLSSFSSGSDELGVSYFRDGEFKQFRKSVDAVSKQVENVRFLMIAPASDQPTMSNSALLVKVSDSNKFLTAFDDAIGNWNRMIETAQRNIDYMYEQNNLKVGSLAGRRYSIDLPTAFRQDNVPEVREVLAKLYGRNGMSAVDVLALDAAHVLVSDLPDKRRNELIESYQSSQRATEAVESGWTVTLHPAALQDWLNDVRRHSYGENVVGWKPKPLDATSEVEIRLSTHSNTLTVEAEIPGDVLEAMGALARGE